MTKPEESRDSGLGPVSVLDRTGCRGRRCLRTTSRSPSVGGVPGTVAPSPLPRYYCGRPRAEGQRGGGRHDSPALGSLACRLVSGSPRHAALAGLSHLAITTPLSPALPAGAVVSAAGQSRARDNAGPCGRRGPSAGGFPTSPPKTSIAFR